MATITQGSAFVWGIHEPLPARGFPAGRIRWRLRLNSVARAFVRTPDGVRLFTVKEADGHWVPAFEIGRNATAPAADLSEAFLAAGYCAGLAGRESAQLTPFAREMIQAASQQLLSRLPSIH